VTIEDLRVVLAGESPMVFTGSFVQAQIPTAASTRRLVAATGTPRPSRAWVATSSLPDR
jgi:hypothetical protein